MSPSERPIIIATRGSALALAQSNAVFDQCRKAFPRLAFEVKIIKTTGDKLQTAAPAKDGQSLPKGLFTKELEVALLRHKADLAVHSLKDLPTELPSGLTLGAVGKRADVREVLIYRDAAYLQSVKDAPGAEWVPGQSQRRGINPGASLKDLPAGFVVATSSPRRKAQILAIRSDLKIVEVRGNVPTRLNKLFERADFDALILAAAGLERLDFTISPEGRLRGDAVPDGLLAAILDTDVMLPCVGQGAVGIEVREADERIEAVCKRLNHFNTEWSVTAERSFLRAMGGGCQSPVGAYAEVMGETLRLRAVSFREGTAKNAEGRRPIKEALELGEEVATALGATPPQSS
jgi:hydroxymethylbilane synthase